MAAQYRAEHVGSLLRPPEVLDARVAHEQGIVSLEQLREIEDRAVLAALAMQQEVGIDVLTDGEMRRSWWSGGIAEAVEGIVDDPEAVYQSRWKAEHGELADATHRESASASKCSGPSCGKCAASLPMRPAF